ncbi:metallophosphoesterase [Planococcus shenhongbingii]|uniref:Metallophosphoesterase n=1 Tax=Planococcus shenhongbingii TaxID=3058398 RepID=A0ABT8NAH5_9BACL|nr:metallophosphoesterase [Planococcus sp. N017]MDN7244877.1 metallophosphoesterase [Planococcus sp. N017]
MRIITYSITALSIYLAIVTYLGWNVYVWFESWAEWIYPVLFGVIWFILAFSFFVGRLGHRWLAFSVIGAYWFAFLEYGLLFFPIANIVSLFVEWDQEALILGNAVAIIFALIFIVGTFLAYSPVVRKLEITVEGPTSDPLHIVVGSDFHLGVLSGRRHLKRFVTRSNKLKPDAVLLAGDLVDDDPVWYARYGMKEEMEKLEAELGVYGVLGNHEYYGKKIPLLVKLMESSGVNILRDETISVGNRFYLTGREDRTNGKRHALELLKPENELPWIILDHTPSDLKTPVDLQADLHISGHTHKGQMWPNRFITKKVFELDYGHRLIEKTHFLVSSGFGFWGPAIRIGSRSELWSIKMKFEQTN